MTEAVRWAALVPELACLDPAASFAFYTGLLGFSAPYEREGFAYLDLGAAQLMLEDMRESRTTGERVHTRSAAASASRSRWRTWTPM